jgi:hypothetical protein
MLVNGWPVQAFVPGAPTETVTTTSPGDVQVKIGFAMVVELNVPAPGGVPGAEVHE